MLAQPSKYAPDRWLAAETVPLRRPSTSTRTVAAPGLSVVDTDTQTMASPANRGDLAWSLEDPQYVCDSVVESAEEPAARSVLAIRQYLRPRVLASAAGGVAVVAAVGLFLTPHSAASATLPVDTSTVTASATAAPAAPVKTSAAPAAAQAPAANTASSASKASSASTASPASKASSASTVSSAGTAKQPPVSHWQSTDQPTPQPPAAVQPTTPPSASWTWSHHGDESWRNHSDFVTNPPTWNWNFFRPPTHTRDGAESSDAF